MPDSSHPASRVVAVLTKADAASHGPQLPIGTLPPSQAGGEWVAYVGRGDGNHAFAWYSGATEAEARATAQAVVDANG